MELQKNAHPPVASAIGCLAVSANELNSLGSIYATPGVLRLLAANGVNPASLLDAHRRGDWGLLCDDDRAANARALKDGSRILSAYEVAGEKVYVITEAVDDSGRRTTTTLLIASEY